MIRDEQGRSVRVIGVLYDVTQRKQMEAKHGLTGPCEDLLAAICGRAKS